MKLLYFRSRESKCTEATEFVVLCDDDFIDESIKEFSSGGFIHKGTFDLIAEKGHESDLPTDRELTP